MCNAYVQCLCALPMCNAYVQCLCAMPMCNDYVQCLCAMPKFSFGTDRRTDSGTSAGVELRFAAKNIYPVTKGHMFNFVCKVCTFVGLLSTLLIVWLLLVYVHFQDTTESISQHKLMSSEIVDTQPTLSLHDDCELSGQCDLAANCQLRAPTHPRSGQR